MCQLFNIIAPGSNNRIATSDVLSASNNVVQAASEYVLKIEEEYFEKKFAEDEMEGGGFPPECAEDTVMPSGSQSSQNVDGEDAWREAHEWHHQEL